MHVAGVPVALADKIDIETARLPGEVARLLDRVSVQQRFTDAVAEYRLDAVKYFHGPIRALLDKTRFNDDKKDARLRFVNVLFAQCVFSGHRLYRPPELWQGSGLVVFNLRTQKWRIVCPAAQKAVIEYLSAKQVLPDVIAVLVRYCYSFSLYMR